MTNFKILYYFESDLLSLIEIKRLLPNETDKSKIFFWLLFDKPEAKLKKLNFVSMHSDGDTELRIFEQEQVAFNKLGALLNLENEEFLLDVMPSDAKPSTQLQQSIDAFLKLF
jgi:hypothetical protein